MRELTIDELNLVSGANSGCAECDGLNIAITGLWAAVIHGAAATIARQYQDTFYTGGCGGGSGSYAWMCA